MNSSDSTEPVTKNKEEDIYTLQIDILLNIFDENISKANFERC